MGQTRLLAIGMHPDLAIASADAAAEFSALLHEHRKIVFKVAASYAWTEADRADLAQEIATQLWSAFRGYDRARPFTTWMYRVALNTGMAHARAESAKGRCFAADHAAEIDSAAATTGSVEETEAMLLLSQVMARLDREDRALLLLHLEARSSSEIADILGISATNVTTRISRIRQRLCAHVS
jgi:RNA polymerase sigma factor (sigma-70 family)